MMDDTLTHQIALAVVVAYVIQWLKDRQWFPLLNADTARLNELCSVLGAFVSSVGIQFALQGTFDTGWHLALSIPPGPVIWDTVIHTIGQFGIQQAIYHGLIKSDRKSDFPYTKTTAPDL